MDGKLKIFLADSSQDFLELLTSTLAEQPDLEVIGCAERGDAAYSFIGANLPDVLVTDLLLPGLDGMSLLRRLKSDGTMPRTLILSAFISEATAEIASRLGVDEYLPKPCNATALVRRIREIGNSAPSRTRIIDNALTIREALMRFGVNSHLNGFSYLLEGIYRVLEDRSSLHGVTKVLYPDLAKHFGTTSVCVERSIRTAVDKAWKTGSPESRRAYFGDLFDGFTRSPTNIRFITAIADFIDLGFAKENIWQTK